MLFKGKSSKLELLIEKIQANKENGPDGEAGSVANEEVSVGVSSWDVGSDGQGSLSPASSATPTSASETDVEAAATVGVTQTTPYQCSFCDRAFPRLSYLKRHEQLHGINTEEKWSCGPACSALHVSSASTPAFSIPHIITAPQLDVNAQKKLRLDTVDCGVKHRHETEICGKCYINNEVKVEIIDHVRSKDKVIHIHKRDATDENKKNQDNAYGDLGVNNSGGPSNLTCTISEKELLPLEQVGENPISKKCQVISKKTDITEKLDEKVYCKQSYSLTEKRVLDTVIPETISFYGDGLPSSDIRWCQEKSGSWYPTSSPKTLRCETNNNSCLFTKDLNQTQWLQLEEKTVDEIMERQCRCHRDRLIGSISLARRLPCQLMDEQCSYNRARDNSIKTSEPYGNQMLDTSEAKEDYTELKTHSLTSEQSTNVWMQDNVYTFVERELKEMENIHTPIRKNDQVSEELFHFVEMELMKLDSGVGLEISPSLPTKLPSCGEVRRTPKDKVTVQGIRACEHSFLASDYGSEGESSKDLYQISNLSEREYACFSNLCHVSGCHDVNGCHDLNRDLLQGESAFQILEKNEIDNDTVLCLRHLDQLPTALMYCSTSFRKKPIDSDLHISQHNNQETLAMNSKLDAKNKMSLVGRARDKQQLENMPETITVQSRKIHIRKKQMKNRMHQNKERETKKILKRRKSKKIFDVLKNNYKLNDGRVKCNKSKNAHNSRQCRNFSYKTHNPATLPDEKRDPCNILIGQKSHDNVTVSSSSHIITKMEKFSKKLSSSRCTSMLPSSKQSLCSSATQFSVPRHSRTPASASNTSLPSETVRCIQPTSVMIQPEDSKSRYFCDMTWDNNLYTYSKSDEVKRMETFHHDIQLISPYKTFRNPYKCTDSLSHSPSSSSIYTSTAPKINLPVNVSSYKMYDSDYPLEIPAVPWVCSLSSVLPSSADDLIQVMGPTLSVECLNDDRSSTKNKCGLEGATSDKFLDSFNCSKPKNQNDYVLSLRYIYTPLCNTFTKGLTLLSQYPRESFTESVMNDSDSKYRSKYNTENQSDGSVNYTSQNFKTYKTVASKDINNELIGIKDCCIQDTAQELKAWVMQELTEQEVFPDVAAKPCSTDKMLPGTVTDQNEKIQTLSDFDEYTKQLRTVPRKIQIQEQQYVTGYKYEDSYADEVYGQSYPVKNIQIVELERGSSPVCFSQKLMDKELFSKQIRCTCGTLSSSMDQNHKFISQGGGEPREEIICISNKKTRCQKENVAEKHISLALPKNQNFIDIDNELEVRHAEDKISGVLLTECNTKEQSNSLSAANTMTMSSVVVKEASKWKLQKYHPYILPKKRHEGMLRIAKVKKPNAATKINKLMNICEEHYCISEKEFLNIDKNPFVHAFETFNSPSRFILHGSEGQFSDQKMLLSSRTSLSESELSQETMSLPQSLEAHGSVDIVNSETLVDEETPVSCFGNDDTESKNEDKNGMHVLTQEVLENSKNTAIELASPEENNTHEHSWMGTQSSLEAIFMNTRFEHQSPKDPRESFSSKTKITDVHEWGEDWVRCSQALQSKVNPSTAKSSKSQEIKKMENMVLGDNGDNNLLIQGDASSIDFDQQKPEAPQPVKTILSNSSPSLSEPGLTDETLSLSKSPSQKSSHMTHYNTKKRHQMSSFNRSIFKQQILDFDTNSSSTSKLDDTDFQINAASQAHRNDQFSFSNRVYPSFTMFDFHTSQTMCDVSSENDARVSLNLCGNISSHNTSEPLATVHPDTVDIVLDAHDRVSVHGKETVVLNTADSSLIPTVTTREDFSLVDSKNAVLISSEPGTVFVMLVDNERTENTEVGCMVAEVEKFCGHSPENKDDPVGKELRNIISHFPKIPGSGDASLTFVKQSHLCGTTDTSSPPNLANSSPVNLNAAFAVVSDSKGNVHNQYSYTHSVSSSNSLLNSPFKNIALTCKAHHPQIKAASHVNETNFSKKSGVSKESKGNFCLLENHKFLEHPEGSCENLLLNNSYKSKMSYHQTGKTLLSTDLKQDETELTEESYSALSKLQPEDNSESPSARKSVSDTFPQKEGKKMLAFPKCKEEQDILEQAVKADLFDVIAPDDSTLYPWPQIEESTLSISPVAQCLKNSDKYLGERRKIIPNANNLVVLHESLEFEKEEKLPFHQERNILTQKNLYCLGRNSTVVPEVGSKNEINCFTDNFSQNNEIYLIQDGDKTSETEISINNKSNAIEGESTETKDESVELKDETAGLKDYHERKNFPACSLTHADQLPFRCEFCGRLFKHKRSRDRHVKLHTGDKKYKCCHCEAAFSRSDHLKIHKKTHDTQKPYQCSVCNRGYNTAAALTAHMQNHKAKLTAHALNQLLKDAQAPGESHALTQLLRDTAVDTNSQALNHFLKDTQKEQLLSPRGIELGPRSSPGHLTVSPVGEPSPTLSPVTTVRCPICHAHCRNQAHLQRHLSRYHGDEMHAVSCERPASRGGGSGASSVGGASSAASTPSPRPPSSLPSPRPLPNPLLSLVGGKLACLYCSRDGFPSLEALQLHLQSAHGSVLNGEVRDMVSMLGLPSSLGTSLSASGLATSLASPIVPGSSRGVSCELCGAHVGGVTALQRHVVTAHTFTDLLARAAEGVFCAQCLLPFSNPGALAEHIKLVHTTPVLSAVLNKRPPSPPTDTPTDLSKKSRHEGLTSDLPASTLLCSQCNAPFTNFEAFRRHLKSHLDGGEQLTSTVTGTTQLTCPECRLPLTSEAALEAHLATHLGITSTEYGCQACLKLFSKPDELQKHLMDIHAHHLYRCALCKEMFDSKVSIQVHFAVKHSNECKVHKCTRCSLIFRSQSEFEGHIRMSHMRRGQSGGDSLPGGGSVGGSGGSYRCLLCTLSLSSEAELTAHVATHQRQFQCSLCDDAFHVEFLLDKHMQTQHNSELNGNVPQPENLAKPRRSPQKKDLRCDICDAEFSTDSGLLNHRKQAHNIKSGSVSVAAKVAAASLSLFCAYCSEACKSRGDLEAHMKSHQGNGGRHKCNICDELCPSAALLAQHKLTHIKVVSGSICAVCREPLTSEQQFTNHQNDHHPAPLPQPCVVCRQTLVTDMEVSIHARFHAAQAAQAAATASAASTILSSGELLPPSSNSSIITTAATVSTVTTSSNSSSHSSSSPRHSPSLRCPECHIKLETIEEAEAHTAAHNHQQQQQGFGRSVASSSRTYQCIKCQESFASEAEIEAHVASHLLHEGSVHECHLCRATFDTPLRLQCHLIEHTFEGCGSFTCYMCSSVFTTASRLQQHMVEHGLSARPYDCHHCHQRFFFRAELENHALSHPEATNGACRECLASFPDLPRRSSRQLSLSSMTTAQHMGAHMTQAQANSDTRLPRPSSPCTACVGDETDARPANGHTTNVADVKDE